MSTASVQRFVLGDEERMVQETAREFVADRMPVAAMRALRDEAGSFDLATWTEMAALGWPPGYVLMIGMIELACVLLYLFPRTSVLGAVLTMGLLGGAMATQIRVGSPLFSHILFSIYLGLFMWGGLWLRDPALREIFPWRRAT